MNNIHILKKQIEIIINLYNSQNFEQVIIKTKVLIKKFPEQLVLYNILALSLSNVGKNEEGLKILNNALRYNNNNIFIFNNLGLLNSNLNNYKLARDYFEKALSINENFVDALVNLANLFLKENKTDLAEINYLKALEITKDNQQLEIINNALGLFYQQVGKFEKSLNYFKIVNKINPMNTAVDKSISSTHKYIDKNDEHLLSMRTKLAKINDKNKLKNLYFALGKAYEDLKDYDNSFHYLKLANDIVKNYIKYNIEKDRKLFNKIKTLFKDYKGNIKIEPKKKFIFIVGMPRSGTTLTEHIISSHKDVYGAGELPFLEKIIKEHILIDNNFNENHISKIKMDTLKKIQSEFIKNTDILNYEEEVLVDKAPLNFRWIGFIKILFPNSKIIHCNREAMDTCFSNYKNSFGVKSLEFSYTLEDLATYHNMYKDLMNFWNNVFCNEIYNIHYEKLVVNQEAETKKLLDFCNLDWDKNCLLPHKNKKRVATASLEQVRNPIYKSSLKKWENYSKHLTTLKDIIN